MAFAAACVSCKKEDATSTTDSTATNPDAIEVTSCATATGIDKIIRLANAFKAQLTASQLAAVQLNYSKTDAVKRSNFPQALVAGAESFLATHQNELDNTYVSYSGNTSLENRGDYVRIDGPSVWIEWAGQGGVVFSTSHPHSVWRDKTKDYGGNYRCNKKTANKPGGSFAVFFMPQCAKGLCEMNAPPRTSPRPLLRLKRWLAAYFFSDAMSITKRYFTSPFSNRS